MTDQTPFVPPGGPPPVAPPAYASPSPYGPPPSIPPAAPPPPQKKMKAGVIVAIVSGSVLLVGGLVVGLIAATSFLTDSIRDGAPVFDDIAAEDPLVTGEEASPVAVEPMECGGCFTDDDLGLTIIKQAELKAVGLTSTLEPWTDYTTHYDSEVTFFRKSWRDAGGDPDECFVTYPGAPISILEPGEIVDDGRSTLGQSVRLFADDQDAVNYMTELSDSIGGCTHYQSGERDTYWEADVTPAPALNLPPSIAGIGWVETTEFYSRFYSFDLQRGNMVVRTSLWTAEEISELEFRALVEHVAIQLAEITPTK